jgi:hypothetical protein
LDRRSVSSDERTVKGGRDAGDVPALGGGVHARIGHRIEPMILSIQIVEIAEAAGEEKSSRA